MRMDHTCCRLAERELSETLPNGLRVFYYPKPDFSKTFAILATQYGSVDQAFTIDGTRFDTPAGVAHFLEHKMFEDIDGNALQKFAQTGASPNAFTSFGTTAYHFSCTDSFRENLQILLNFVFTTYFTAQNVEKERGIIAQEINMIQDNPDWQAFMGVYKGLYHEHPVHTSVAGSVESIASITPETLLQCHKAFYNPSNMALIVVGTADFDEVIQMAGELSPAPATLTRHYGTRNDTAAHYEITKEMAVSIPIFAMGIKDKAPAEDDSPMRQRVLGSLAARLVCGASSPLYVRLYADHLINASFDADYSLYPACATAIFSGQSRNPHAVRDAIELEIATLARDGVPEVRFAHAWRAQYGMTLRRLDQPEAYAQMQLSTCFDAESILSLPEIYDGVTASEVQRMLLRWARANCTTLSCVVPETNIRSNPSK